MYRLVPTKNSKPRTIIPVKLVIELLRKKQNEQYEFKNLIGNAWNNPNSLVFTDEFGHHLTNSKVYRHFKRISVQIGRPDARFHDLRHSYAVVSLQAGDDIKTLQGNLGHATASFTLDQYGHVTDDLKKASATLMNKFMETLTQ